MSLLAKGDKLDFFPRFLSISAIESAGRLPTKPRSCDQLRRPALPAPPAARLTPAYRAAFRAAVPLFFPPIAARCAPGTAHCPPADSGSAPGAGRPPRPHPVAP
jgi:hypothetical protein